MKEAKAIAKQYSCLYKGHHSPEDLPRRQVEQYEREDTEILSTRQFLVPDSSKTKELEDSKTEQEFETLVRDWKRATSRYSIITQKIIHPAYLRIIGMGEKVLPLILKELQQNPSISWFTALEAISGENAAIEPESIDQAISDWLDWGEERHYLNS